MLQPGRLQRTVDLINVNHPAYTIEQGIQET